MFKKPFKISAQNQLSGKDRKTMRNKLAQTYDQACVDKIFNANDKMISCKTSGSKMLIYNGNDYPLFVDGTGKNDYFPSLYVVMAYQPLIKVVELNEGVESYIFNGANLMWPGVRDISGLGQFAKDQVVAIRSAKGELIAIGALGCSSKQLKANADKSGVAVYILHYLNDKLWQSGPKSKPELIVAAQKPKPKQQKKQQIVEQKKQSQKQQKQQAKQKKQQKQDKKKKQKNQQLQQQKVNQKQKEKGKNKQKNKKKQSSEQQNQKQKQKKKQPEKQSSDQADFSNFVHSKQQKAHHAKVQRVQKKQPNKKTFSEDQEQQKKTKKKPQKKQTKKKAGKKQSGDEQQNQQGQQKKQAQQQPKSSVSTKLMDQQFKQAFLNALKLSKVQGQLPIDSGRFFMDFMLLARQPGTKLQIKDTSYKKLGKFYEQMSKQKFIQFKHSKDKKGQQGSTIAKILWDNQQLKNYQPTILKMSEKQVQQKQQTNDSKKKNVKLKLTQTLSVQTAYKLHQNFKNAVFAKKVNYAPTEQQQIQMKKQEQQLKNQPQFYSQQQVRALIQRYINEKMVPKKQKKQKQKQKQKQDKQKKVDKMVVVDYKNNKYLAQLLKRQIEQFQQNAQGDKQQASSQEQEGKKGKKKRQNIMKIDRGALVNRILKTCSTSYLMRDKENGFESFNQGTFKGIQLVAQKTNNKNITKIIGLETFIFPKDQIQQQINILANKLKQKFACSVNIQNLPGKNAGKQIIVHGNFISQLQDMFTDQYKINQDYITSQNKLDKKKKR